MEPDFDEYRECLTFIVVTKDDVYQGLMIENDVNNVNLLNVDESTSYVIPWDDVVSVTRIP